jgi:hypothetical protein
MLQFTQALPSVEGASPEEQLTQAPSVVVEQVTQLATTQMGEQIAPKTA